MAGINLDDLFEEAPEDAKLVGEQLTGGLSIRNKPQHMAVKDTSEKAVYDEYKVLLYAIDISGSMAEPLISENAADYDWPPQLKDFVKKFGNSEYIGEDIKDLMALIDLVDEEELKKTITSLNPNRFGIYRKPASIGNKMDLVRKSVADLVDRRYEKNPNARVALMTFNTDAQIEAATRDSIKTALHGMYPAGGTNIYAAVTEALRYFEKYPSPVGLHHIVLVTDGEDWNAVQVVELKEKMKELGLGTHIKPQEFVEINMDWFKSF